MPNSEARQGFTHCPLESAVWLNEGNDDGRLVRIAEYCQEICGSLVNTALTTGNPEIDTFDRQDPYHEECDCHFEHGGIHLKRYDDSARREVSVLNVCAENGGDAFSESYRFDCKNN